MAKAELFRGPFAWLFPRLGAFPVRRGEADPSALATAREILGEGGVLVVFPEDTRVDEPDALDLVVVNGVYPDRFTDEEAERIEALATRPHASGALDAALREHRRARSHNWYVRWLRERVHAPVITLPYSFSAEIGPARYAQLADDLTAMPGHAPSAMVPG